MTSRERVLAALSHREPDRVPVDMGGMRSTGIMAMAYGPLKSHLGIRGGATYVYDMVQQLAQPEDPILNAVGVDVIDLGRAYGTSPEDWRDWVLPDGAPCKVPTWAAPIRLGDGWAYVHADGTSIGEMRPGMSYFDQTCFPLAGREATTLDELRDAMGHVIWGAVSCAPWHQLATEEDYANLGAVARRLQEDTDYAVMVAFGGNLIEWAQFLCGMENLLLDVALRPHKVEALLDMLVELHLDGIERLLAAVGDHVQLIQFGDDLGTQQGPQISPQLYRELFKPRHAAMFQRVKQRCNAAVFFHSCGGIYELIPDLIEAGVDALNPVQTSAAGMDPSRLKREFGADVTFWGGGCDTQTVLPSSSPSEVSEHVRRRLETFAPGGGYVFAPVHNVQSGVPPENVVAMYEAARR